MEDVFWSRSATAVKAAELFVITCMPQGATQQRIDKIMSVFREFNEMMFPHRGADREKQETKLRNLMSQPDFMKEMTVTAISDG